MSSSTGQRRRSFIMSHLLSPAADAAQSFDSILGSRLILNLRRVSKKSSNVDTTSDLNTTNYLEPTFVTNPFLGNIGAPLRDGSDSDTDYDDGDVEDSDGQRMEATERGCREISTSFVTGNDHQDGSDFEIRNDGESASGSETVCTCSRTDVSGCV